MDTDTYLRYLDIKLNEELTDLPEIIYTGETIDFSDYFDEDEPWQPIYDSYGNPTEATIRALYEDEHDIGETFTPEEFFAELDKLRAEAGLL